MAPVDTAVIKIKDAVRMVEFKLKAPKTIDSGKLRMSNKMLGKGDQADSIGSGIKRLAIKVGGAEEKYTGRIDSVLINGQTRHAINKLTLQIDSLRSAGQPYDKYSNKLDSIKKVSSLEEVRSALNKKQSSIQQLQNTSTDKINEKLSLLSKEANGQGNLPGNVTSPGLKAEGIDLPDIKLPGSDVNINPGIPSIDVPTVTMPDDPLNKDLSINPDLSKGISSVTDPLGLGKLKAPTDELSDVSENVSGYADDVKDIKDQNLDKVEFLEKDAVSKLPVNEELKVIQEQDQLIKDQQAKAKSYKNPEEYKRQTLARAKKMVTQQLASQEKTLQESIGKVSQYHRKAGTVLSKTNDSPKKRDPLRKLKPFERLVPGITLQVQKPGAWLVDFNPSLQYRLTSYWSIGTGWNERVVFGDYSLSYDQTRIYGVRTFTEVIIFKGLSARLEAEDMNTPITSRQSSQDVKQRGWIWSYSAGIKKDFSFIPRVTGNVQFMYNVYRSNEFNPYPSRFNVRFGFERMLIKKQRKKGK